MSRSLTRFRHITRRDISGNFVSFRFVTTLISGIAVSCIVLLTFKGFPVIGSANELELIGNEFPDIFRNN